MPRILLLSTTTGYQTRMFGEAAERLGVDLVFATDRCDQLEDPWRDEAVPVRFYDEEDSLVRLLASAAARRVDGILAVGDRPTVLAARAAEALGLPGHPPEAARRACNKLLTRRTFQHAPLLSPWHLVATLDADPDRMAARIPFPCVVKPLALSASRGVIRANNAVEFSAAFDRVRRLLQEPEIRAMRDPANTAILIEEYIDGPEFAVEAILERGRLGLVALFDKPDPLVGPYFEETIYVTPSGLPPRDQASLVEAVTAASAALGLHHGPVHAECRRNDRGVFVLEVAARPIGGLCARAIRFDGTGGQDPHPSLSLEGRGRVSFEELLLRHALGEPTSVYTRESNASALMMIPIPAGGYFRRVEGLEEALAVKGIEDIRVTAKPGQRIRSLPEGASYLGFIFARAGAPDAAVAAIREAHRRLRFTIESALI